jgi:prepilin-type N-terminal cleavage/methylation domain-containing protein
MSRFGQRNRRGFTLTELAVVLGVIGTVLAAIWVASGRVSAGNKAQRAVAQVLSIVGNYRTLYAQHGVDDPTNFDDITCTGVNAGFFPNDMLQTGTTCVTGTTTTYPSGPWGTATQGQYVQVEVNQTYSGVAVTYAGLTQAACNNLADAISTAPDAIYENINGTNQYLSPFTTNTPYTTSQINGDCTAGNNDFVQVMFKAR